MDVISNLIENNKELNPNIQSTMDGTPLHCAIKQKDENMVRVLLNHKHTNPNHTNHIGSTALDSAI